MKKSYIDSNILLAKYIDKGKNNNQYRKSVKIFDEIKCKNITVIISYLTLMEINTVIKKHKVREIVNSEYNFDKKLKIVLEESLKVFNNIHSELSDLPNVEFELSNQINFNKILPIAFNILQKIQGKIWKYSDCSRCGTTNVNYSKYKGLGADDVIHALLAKNSGCHELITFDKDFNELVNISEFKSLSFRILKS